MSQFYSAIKWVLGSTQVALICRRNFKGDGPGVSSPHASTRDSRRTPNDADFGVLPTGAPATVAGFAPKSACARRFEPDLSFGGRTGRRSEEICL